MVGSDEMLADWLAPHSIAFGVGVAVAVVTIWLVRPTEVLTIVKGPIGLILVVVSIVTVLASERYRETLRREPPYFVAGVVMGVALSGRLIP